MADPQNGDGNTIPNPTTSGAYLPGAVEDRIYRFWKDGGWFASKVNKKKKPYTIVIPPPNVTGALHLGHALNNTIQDVLIRHHRQAGFEACWIPGTDHAGIATQSVVEKRLHREEGKTRHDFGREEMIQRIWVWKEEYEKRILGQLERLGCSCDWDRTSFTMSDTLSAAVRHVFIKLFRDGLIYRGQKLINWSPGLQTALSNDELVYKNVKAHFWHLRYPLKGKAPKGGPDAIEVATTRPETMLGDTAVAVHPDPRAELTKRLESSSETTREAAKARLDDAAAMKRLEAFAKLIGKEVELPLTGRTIPIIGDPILADPAKGTGAVKVTPAHDPNDYACGLRNNLPMINILNDDGTLNENVPEAYRGLNGPGAGRNKVVEDLTAGGFMLKIEDLEHEVAHCYRSHTVVEPYLSDQWFVKMQPLVELARNAVLEKRVKFVPPSREKLYLDWLDSTPDWCISRQIWWGHRIPVWYCAECGPEIKYGKDGQPLKIVGEAEPILPPDDNPHHEPTACPKCKSKKLVQDPDVLDTWFSSQLWPLSTLGWPEHTKDLDYFYPTSVLSTARDIIALWVARMIMMGEKFSGEFGKGPDERQPFHDVYIHSTIQDERGDIMSKSRGNGFDPVAAIDGRSDELHGEKDLPGVPKDRVEHYVAYGADALRFALMSMCTLGQDIKMAIERSERKAEKPKEPKADKEGGKGKGKGKGEKKGDKPLREFDVNIPRFEEGRRFCNKIWQASNGLVLAGLEDGFTPIDGVSPYLEDRWLAHRLRETVEAVTTAIRSYRFNEAADEIYRLFWNDYCSFYLEMIKPRLWGDDETAKSHARTTSVRTLDAMLRVMHPIMPFITEELWQRVRTVLEKSGASGLPAACIVAPWPEAKIIPQDADAAAAVKTAREIITALNTIRAEQTGLKDGTRFPKVIITGPASVKATLDSLQPLFAGMGKLTKAEQFEAGVDLSRPSFAAAAVVGPLEILVPLEGLIDVGAEKARLEKEIARVADFVKKLGGKLSNEKYTANAPADVVQKDRDTLA
ncbi:MAG: valine--tRNA ligase, partial [Planctomycetota bacterium]